MSLSSDRVALVFAAALCFVFTDAGSGQQNELNPSARDAFWSAADLVGKPPPPGPRPHVTARPDKKPINSGSHRVTVNDPLGLRYSLLKHRPDGTFDEVSPASVFQLGDKIRMKLMPNQAGYLYIIQQGSSGAWSLLYPPAGTEGTNRLEAGQEYLVPSRGLWTIQGIPGQEKIFVMLTHEPEADLDRVISSIQGVARGIDTNADPIDQRAADKIGADIARTEEGLRRDRDLVYTDSDDDPDALSSSRLSGDKDQATYVINKLTQSADPKIVVNVVLQHR